MPRILQASRKRLTHPSFVLLAALSCEPIKIGIQVSNETDETIEIDSIVSAHNSEFYIPVTAHTKNAIVELMPYDGLCSPPDRWLSNDFRGLKIRYPDGTVRTVSREEFLSHARYDHHWHYVVTK